MRTIHLALTATAALAVGGCATMPADAPAMAVAAGDMTPEQAMPFVMLAGASDLYEIESSRIALTRAQQAEVRQFARMLIDHHTATTQQVMAAARAAGLNPPPPQLLPMQRQMLANLRGAPDSGFDAVYLRQQVPAHEMALALHRNYASAGDTPSLRQAASGAVPIVTRHLEQARRLTR